MIQVDGQIRNPVARLAAAALLAALLCLGVAGAVFEWRNPKANRMALWRELPAVLRFERLHRYQ